MRKVPHICKIKSSFYVKGNLQQQLFMHSYSGRFGPFARQNVLTPSSIPTFSCHEIVPNITLSYFRYMCAKCLVDYKLTECYR